ncbi:MAG: asparagine synthase (glutamine-hydrolyzing) [Thermoleophilia bacterium]|nr:asparagine synthase (glutamine-hydrolyzing) [Thermoleophilia bacterium]
MCGICGLVRDDGGSPDRALLEAMRDTLVHRGPDSAGLALDGPAGLAARRLAVIDVEGGDQPLANEDGTVTVVQNGEIYNYRELRRWLAGRGHSLRTRSDTEVLAHLYEEDGPSFVLRLRGMFALALWDARRGRLVLARDRFGIKPLFYARARGALAFASELKALLRESGFSREVDPEALRAYLAFNSVPAPYTIFREARKLPPGHLLTWEPGRGEPRLERYARPAPAPVGALRTESEAELAVELRARLADSVRAHLVADVPVGVLLSGGVDSSALAAFAATESPGRVSTFTIGFEESSFDERGRARLVAERYGTDHHELVLRPDAATLLGELAVAFDEPLGDSSAIPTYLVSRLAAGHVKVVLSGEGADELFGGYFTYVADGLAPWLGPAARAARPLVELLPSSSRRVGPEYMAKRFARAAHLPPLERHHGWKEILSPELQAELVLPARRGSLDPVDLLRVRYAETEGAAPLARLQDVDLGLYLVDDLLVKTDRASMAHSLEVRVPYLDTVVADLALALPDRLKVHGLAKKRLLRRAVEPLLPREIARGAKRGFSIPAAAWLRGELEPFARDVLSRSRLERQGFFQPGTVEGLLARHAAGEEDLSRPLWGLLSFSLWHERYGS